MNPIANKKNIFLLNFIKKFNKNLYLICIFVFLYMHDKYFVIKICFIN